MPLLLRARAAALLVTLASPVAFASAAHAATPEELRAREAYDRGTAAYDRGDFATAARELAAADALAPSPIALQAGLDAALRADDPVIGMELLDRTARLTPSGELASLVQTARARFAHRTGRVRVACGAAPCVCTVDGANVESRAYVRIGAHAITIQSGGRTEQRVIDVHDGETIDLAPSPAPVPALPPRSGLSPAWFFVGVGATAVLAGATTWSGIDTSKQHSDFEKLNCAQSRIACVNAASDGNAAQTRTNVLLGATAVVGLATAAVGVFLVRWRTGAVVSVGLVGSGAGASVRTSF